MEKIQTLGRRLWQGIGIPAIVVAALIAVASIAPLPETGPWHGRVISPVAHAQAFYESVVFRATGKLLLSDTAPTVTSAGTTPSVTASNGSANFIVNVGTGGTANTIVMAMPTATTGWTCTGNDITAAAASVAAQGDHQTASTASSVTMVHYTVSSGAVLAYTAADLVRFQCSAY